MSTSTSASASTSAITDIDYGTWLNCNGTQLNNWVVINNYDEIFNHIGRQFFKSTCMDVVKDDRVLKVEDMGHIYATFMSSELLISIIRTKGKHGQLYLIRNQVSIAEAEAELTVAETTNNETENEIKLVDDIPQFPEIKSIESKLYLLNSLRDVVSILSRKDRKSIGIIKNQYLICKNKKDDVEHHRNIISLAEVEPDNVDEYIATYNKIYAGKDTINLAHNYSITSNILNQFPINNGINQIILNKNHQLHDFTWFTRFPRVCLLNCYYMNSLTYDNIVYICKTYPYLNYINFYNCCRLNIRILKPLLHMTYIEKIVIEDENFWCQKGPSELFISHDEWEGLDCVSLKSLVINSTNMTVDVVDYILKSCTKLESLVVDESVFANVQEKASNGYENERIVFVPFQNQKKGLQYHRNVRFSGMYKDNYNTKVFTDSFMDGIKKRELQREALERELEAEIDAEENA